MTHEFSKSIRTTSFTLDKRHIGMNPQGSVYETLGGAHDYGKRTRWYAVSYYELSMSDEMMMIEAI
jgi:hypothetical protein